MKKTIVLFSVILFIIMCPFTAFAEIGDLPETKEYIEYFYDGSYAVVKMETNGAALYSTSSKTTRKSYNYYSSNNKLEWTATLTGSFSYTGSSASCTSSSLSFKIYDDAWKVKSSQASKSGRTATGDFTIKRYTLGIPVKSVTKTITISCSNTGVCS